MRGAPLLALAMLFALSACVTDPTLTPSTAAPPTVAAVPAAPPAAPSPAPIVAAPAQPEGPIFVRPDGSAPCASGEPFRQTGRAHFYGRKFHGRRTANGERFDMTRLTAAHNSMPFGTRAKVTNLANNHTVVVRITDRHAEWSSKAIDLSQAAAEQLGFRGQGIATVAIEALCGRGLADVGPAVVTDVPRVPPPSPRTATARSGKAGSGKAVTVRAASARAPAKVVPVRPPVKPVAARQPPAMSPTTRERTRSALPGR